MRLETNPTELGIAAPPGEPKPLISGRYRIDRLIGGGGCGLVYAARHEMLGKPVALKIMRNELVRDPAQAQRFFREAKLAATLHHENIVDINDFGTDDATGAPYLVMGLLRGHTLMDAMRTTGALPWPRVVGIMQQLSRALACAHGQGVLHRDIKPHNVMLEEASGGAERVKLCDFGLSRLRTGNDRTTSTGNFIGTPAYMAPEQLRGGDDQDARCDLYALGVTGYEMLTGELPYRVSTPVALVTEILGDHRVPIRERVDTELPDALVDLIERCIAPDPASRPATAIEIEDALDAIAARPTRAVTDLVGQEIGSYRVVAPLGTGGSGSVWLAEHPVIGTKVAIKVLRPEIAALPGVAERFVNEARATSIIGSPHIARYLDLGWLQSGQPYAVLEYLAGETVFERLARLERFAVGEAIQIARQVASAFVLAHSAGIIHRDIKPENVFLTDSHGGVIAKVLDFGIAKLSGSVTDGAPKTQTGYFMGTVAFCPPEQILGEEIGPAADVYALGATLFNMLAGRPPFSGDGTQIATAKTTRPAPPLRELRSDVPRPLAALVDAMLATSPQDRPTMADVGDRLQAMPLQPEPVVRAPAPEPPRIGAAILAPRRLDVLSIVKRLDWPRVGVGVGVLATALAGVLLIAWPSSSRTDARPAAPAPVQVQPLHTASPPTPPANAPSTHTVPPPAPPPPPSPTVTAPAPIASPGKSRSRITVEPIEPAQPHVTVEPIEPVEPPAKPASRITVEPIEPPAVQPKRAPRGVARPKPRATSAPDVIIADPFKD